ncbi:MAG: helix-turn-helix domain-containing protein [Acidimicrobiales bacterium]|nr:helix-turn-helix domain-containing protein [Acidimicrobiales bacterium]RZV44076.1 MAG: IclR family transcriptional regulator [Acidimicrobiales bacterium]
MRVGRSTAGRDFVEALARGISVLTAFSPMHMEMTVTEVAERTGLARPTARRLLLTLEELGYLRSDDGRFSLTPKVLEIGTATIAAQGLWDIARPHMVGLVSHTLESSSMSQLDGSDVIYVARVPVPKIIAVAVSIGTRFPAVATSMGRVLLADLDESELTKALAAPSISAVVPVTAPSRAELDDSLEVVREQGWALADEILSMGVRSVAAPVRNSDGRAVAALNVTVHAAETSVDELISDHLPLLLETADAITADWAALDRLPVAEAAR